jgi:DNA (cytosine-5)-methyltransferase 1
MTFIDYFSGIGGFRLGMEMAGHKCLGHCEIDKFADKSYRAMHDVKEDEWYADNIRNVEPGDLPEADCYCGGFPCQAFSVAGKRGGFEDTRGTLFFEVMRLAAVRKPKYLFLENVAGLLSHDGGKTFGAILNTLGELGYWYEYQVLNSKNHGVPQNRERVFIVGHLGGYGGRQIFPIGGENNEYSTIGESTETAIARTFTAGGHSGGNHSGMTIIKEVGKVYSNRHSSLANSILSIDGISPTLDAMQGGNRQPKVKIECRAVLTEKRTEEAKKIRSENLKKGIDYSPRQMKQFEPRTDGITNTLTTVQKDNLLLIPEATKKGYAEAREGDSINLAVLGSKTRRGRVGKGIANTLDTSCNQGVIAPCLHGFEHGTNGQFNNQLKAIGMIRRLTPKECFRLQGFPDEYFERAAAVNSDSQLYKQAGNSVTVNVIYEIARRL